MGVPEKAIVSGEQILEYIPQRAPIVMVDSFYGIDEGVATTQLMVNSDNIFCEDGHLNESGIIEHIAQSAAVRSGYEYINKGKEVPIGYIGTVEKLTIHKLPNVGQVMTTAIVIEQEIMNITLISASVEVDGEAVAECKMKIFLEQ